MSARAQKLPALRGRNAEVMLALRAGPMTAEQIEARYGSTGVANTLVRYGLVERTRNRFVGLAYALTDLGRDQCPSRRALYETADSYLASKEQRELAPGIARGRPRA